MLLKSKSKFLIFLFLSVVLGLITTLITDSFTKSVTSPTNIIYSADNVIYSRNPILLVTKSNKRGFPFNSETRVVNKYINEEIPGPSTTVQLPSISSMGSNSFTRIFLTWQFYADVLIWTIVWLLLWYSIKFISNK